MPVRRSTGKRIRFEVFKRDYFTCQYCGAQPPGVVLVTDHIDPVSNGGPTSIDNLLTSCEACNQGKSDRTLGDRVVRPDSDLLYLQTQQEIVELRRYRESIELLEEELAYTILVLQDRWCKVAKLGWHPSDNFVRRMLVKYAPGVVGSAMEDVAAKLAGGYIKERAWVPYLWAVARNIAAAEERTTAVG